MARYSHAFDIAFQVESNEEDASDVTNEMLLRAIIDRIANTDELVEACGMPFDTYEIEEK